MTPKHNQTPKTHYDWQSEKFDEPRTMPAGWDLSGLHAGHSSDQRIADNHYNTKDAEKSHSADQNWQSEKFEEPRTTPKNWDVSSLK